ncbi:MFS transporter [Niabella hirudinis]|uniref:MFS transporter n=1 Tax=Niabella hirudinis TaxID=1285929 RepID=UPI003EBD7441
MKKNRSDQPFPGKTVSSSSPPTPAAKGTSFRKQQWKMLLACMFCYMFFYTGRHNFGWAAKALAADLGVRFSAIGLISSSMLIGYAIGQLVNGNLADRFSPRKMVFMGALFSVTCNFAISFSHSYTQILILWMLNGYFQSLAWAPGSRIISNWWGPKERGKAFGFYTMAAGSSSVVTFLISILIVQQNTTWQYLFRLPVLFLLVAVIIFYLVVRNKPSDTGFNNLSGDTLKAAETHWTERYKAVFGNRRFMIASLALGFENMARYGLIVWVPVHYLGGNWKDSPPYLWVTVLMPLGMALGAFSFGTISDKFFNRNRPASIRTGMLISALLALLIFAVPVHNLVLSSVLMFAAGFFVYGPQANFWPMSPDLLGEKYVGTGVGIMNMFAYIFAALGEPLLGWIIDKTGNSANVFIAIMIICLICAGIISLVHYRTKEATGAH